MPSGKQVLLHFLQQYSLSFQQSEDLPEVSENLRVAFLLHGSTPPDMWQHVDNVEWGNEMNEENKITKQGLKVKGKDIMLSELFQQITWEDEKVPTHVAERFPEITSAEYQSATHLIWLLLKSIEYSDWLSQVEDDGKMDFERLEKWLVSYRKKMNLFREDPDDFF